MAGNSLGSTVILVSSRMSRWNGSRDIDEAYSLKNRLAECSGFLVGGIDWGPVHCVRPRPAIHKAALGGRSLVYRPSSGPGDSWQVRYSAVRSLRQSSA